MSKLAERIKKYGIPKIPGLPKGKVVLVFRLPAEEVTAGGIILTEDTKEPKFRGVLLAAGLTARDEMRDHLFEIGDIVEFGRFAGWEKEVERSAMGKGKSIIEMKIEDINISVDGLERFENDYTIEYDEETGQHHYEPKKTTTRRKAA